MSNIDLKKINSLRRPIVFTNGVFDILHIGHVKNLVAAKKLGKSLVVGINSDASVKKLAKGPDRPFNTSEARKGVIRALKPVDYTFVFTEDNPLISLEIIQPEIYVKGGDYSVKDLPEAKLVSKWGGKCVILDFLENYSTTNLVNKIRNHE